MQEVLRVADGRHRTAAGSCGCSPARGRARVAAVVVPEQALPLFIIRHVSFVLGFAGAREVDDGCVQDVRRSHDPAGGGPVT